MNRILRCCLWLLLSLFCACSSPSKPEAITIRLAQDPESLHPLSYANAHSLQLLNLVYQSLLTVDLKDNQIKPVLAAGLPQVAVKDSLSYFTFRLRPEAEWDNGSPVTARDVAFSLKAMHSPLLENDRWRAQYAFIKDIQEHPQEHGVFTIVCSGYTPEMQLMTGDFLILPQHKLDPDGLLTPFSLPFIKRHYDSLGSTTAFKQFAEYFQHEKVSRDTAVVRGSGPYKIVSWNSGQHVLLNKKDNWWGDKLTPENPVLIARPKQLLYQIIPDNAAATMALKAQQLDVMDNIPLVSFQEMKKDPAISKNFHFYSPPTFDLVFMGMNGTNPLLQDRRTRQAIAHLLNIPQYIKTLQGGLASPTVGLVHPSEKQFYHQELQPLPFSPAKARQLLTEAGWRNTPAGWKKKIDGKEQTLSLELLLRGGNSDFENMALLLQQNARAIGVPVHIRPLESSQISERLANRNFQLYFRILTASPFSYNLVSLLHTSAAEQGGANVTSFGTPESDRLLTQIAREEDPAQKARQLKRLQEIMQQESNLVFLYFQQNKIAIASRIDSVVVSRLKPNYDVSRFSVSP